MKPKTMILMGLAITCGLGASWMTSRLLAGRQTEEVENVTILVAKRKLSVGEPIKKPEDMFEAKKVPAVDARPESIHAIDPTTKASGFDSLKNKIMKTSLREGDHITAAELFGDKDQLPIPEGYQAVGLRVTMETSGSGFATLPLSRVNVIHTVRRSTDNESYSQILLQDVLILAADTKTGRDDGIAAPAQVVTVALKDEDILRVNLAKEMGTLSLALRKPNDHSRTDYTIFSANDLKKKKTDLTVPEEALPPQAPPVILAKTSPESPKAVDKPSSTETKPAPVVEGPKGIGHTMTIINGTDAGDRRVERVRFRVGEDGQPIIEESNEAPSAIPPTTPKKKVQDDL